MKYQLVLQWPSESPAGDYEALLATENLLRASLACGSEVDGHDAGSGQSNIFILTNDPLQSFSQVKSALGRQKAWQHLRAAYREVSGNRYTVLWPEHLIEFAVV